MKTSTGGRTHKKSSATRAEAAGVTHHQVHQADELRDEEYESEDSEAQDGVGRYFAADVSVEQAHLRAGPF